MASARDHVIRLGHGEPLDFDDIGYLHAQHRVVVPEAQAGAIALIDPDSGRVTTWAGITPRGNGSTREDRGTTSADAGDGLIFASDHADQAVVVIDPHNGLVLSRAHLQSGPDYVRYVASLHQVWVTEPHAAQIERFGIEGGAHPRLRLIGALAVPHGPESLVIDNAKGLAYTNEWNSHTLVITLHEPHISARWSNPCQGSRGLALARARHLLFVGCKEGRVVALRTNDHGSVAGTAKVGSGVDIIAWNPHFGHLYAPGARSATLSVVAVDARGHMKVTDTVASGPGSHCVATDGLSHAYVCLPEIGSVLVYHDSGTH